MKFRTRYNFDSSVVREHVNTGEVLVDEVHKPYKKLIQEAILSGSFAQLLNAKAYYELEGNTEKLDELYRVVSDLSDDMVIEKERFFGGDVVDFASLTDSYISLVNEAYSGLIEQNNKYLAELKYNDKQSEKVDEKKTDVPTD